MNEINRVQSVAFLDVGVIDRDIDFLRAMIDALKILGIRRLHYGASVKYAEQLIRRPATDIIFIEKDDKYSSVWEYILLRPNRRDGDSWGFPNRV